MVDDQQTHAIPRGAAAMDRVAQLHGLVNGEALLDLLRPHVERTGRYYDGLVADSDDERLPNEKAELVTWMNGAGLEVAGADRKGGGEGTRGVVQVEFGGGR